MIRNLRIKSDGGTREIKVSQGSTLLNSLQENNFLISAPCAGNGTCGKCSVEKDGGKMILACQHIISDDLEISIPQANEMKIQSESYFPDLNIIYNSIDSVSYGIAVDLGTTTVVVYLEALADNKNIATTSFVNPQNSFGADVISRIQFASEDKGLKMLQASLIKDLDKAIRELCKENEIESEAISRVCISGNTTMLHILKGVDPTPLASYPFTPVFTDLQRIEAKEIDIEAIPNAIVDLLPSLSAYVGADIIAGIASSELPDESDYSLFIDIGTNGEMALGNKDKILCCATAAGPAFEGAKISSGMGGVKGAIHKFSEEGYETIGNSKPLGLCGSGLIDVISHLLKTKKLDPTGYLEEAINFLPGSELSLTPQDIREVQLAKGAIAAGIHTLVNKAEIGFDQISKVYLAGGFGYAINPKSAAEIGLFPDELISKIIRAGNTSGLGARLFLQSDDFASRLKRIAAIAEHFDLSTDMGFNESFVMNMGFPDQS